MILNLLLALTLQNASPPPAPDWSTECLSQVGGLAGSQPQLDNRRWTREARRRADEMWAMQYQALQLIEGSNREADALWRRETAGEVPAGAAEAQAADIDRQLVQIMSQFSEMISATPACGLRVPVLTIDGRREERAVRQAALGAE
ncbi:MAG: hypothetical protein EON95_21560 [Caulobacteraceae bacterium]|nr:MAG: hypothetical protein EON95_21560 [Caulobacteraceae bacterium]